MPALRDVHTQLDLVLGALRRYPDREAFRQDDRGFTYREIADLLGRWGAVLARLGVGERGGVGLLSPNRPEVWLGQVAPGLVGGRYTALHPLGSLEDHLYMVREAELRVLLIDPAYAERGAQLLERSGVVEHVLSFGPCEVGRDVNAMAADAGPHALPASAGTADQLSWLLYTGGTTGVPKAAMLTEGGLGQMILNVSTGWDLPSERRYLAVAPISHAAGMMVTPTLMRGGTVVLQKGWDPQRWLDLVARERITMSLLVPTMIYSLLDAPGLAQADLATLETIMYGASPMSPSRLVEGIERIGPVFSQLYGQTECAGITSCLWRHQHVVGDLHRLTSCGQAMPGARVAILDDDGRELPDGTPGEICVQSPTVMQGYFRQPALTEETLAGGWLHTGDVGTRDPEGFLHIVDRKKDMIVTGGFNVFPREIEDVLSQDPAVSAAAVIGVPDERWGEAVKALVVARPGATVDATALIERVRAAKGAIHAPKTVEVVASLPLTPVGKPDKKVLRAPYWAGRTRRVN
ncbi:MAG TPA: AMP-binding protein [Burkholderiaceae bacterium]|nr:AMP-binding protein [Burkholderiaceae bacterium]